MPQFAGLHAVCEVLTFVPESSSHISRESKAGDAVTIKRDSDGQNLAIRLQCDSGHEGHIGKGCEDRASVSEGGIQRTIGLKPGNAKFSVGAAADYRFSIRLDNNTCGGATG